LFGTAGLRRYSRGEELGLQTVQEIRPSPEDITACGDSTNHSITAHSATEYNATACKAANSTSDHGATGIC
jgi:hypothetical protein